MMYRMHHTVYGENTTAVQQFPCIPLKDFPVTVVRVCRVLVCVFKQARVAFRQEMEITPGNYHLHRLLPDSRI